MYLESSCVLKLFICITFTRQFLSLGIFDILGWIILCCGGGRVVLCIVGSLAASLASIPLHASSSLLHRHPIKKLSPLDGKITLH